MNAIRAVSLQPDELFSSWLARFALTRGCDPLSLTGSLWRSRRTWTRDTDRGLPDLILAELCGRTGVSADALNRSFLPARAPLAQVDARHPVWPWILPVGTRNRLRRGGLQFCPQCLGADRAPYFRVHWRLAWHTCCVQHGTLLLDRCLNCSAPVEPHRLTAADENLAICATCRVSLATCASDIAPNSAFDFQCQARRAEAEGHGDFGALRLTRVDWFGLARYLTALLRRASVGKPQWSINRMLACLDLLDTRSYRSSTGLRLELLPTRDRAVLLGGVAHVMGAGVDRFVEAARTAGVTRRTLGMVGSGLPAQVEARIDRAVGGALRKRKPARPKLPGIPKSPASVAQSWARLYRRIAAELR